MNRLKILTGTTIIFMLAILIAPRLQLARAAAPANDDFFSATITASLPFSDAINVREATIGPNDPTELCGVKYTPNNSVWYSYTPVESRPVQISTAGSSYNTVVAVFSGEYSALREVGCNDGTQPFIVPMNAGMTYSIMVIANPSGIYPFPFLQTGGDLQISLTESNDMFVNASHISELPFQDTVDIRAATIEREEPISKCSGGTLYHTIWYEYTPLNKELMSGDAQAKFGHVLSVYTGSDLANLTELACATNSETFQISLSARTTYFIQVGSLELGQAGSITLQMQSEHTLINDDFANATSIGNLPFTETLNNYYTTTEPDEPSPGCLRDGVYRTAWYSYAAREAGLLDVQTLSDPVYTTSFIAAYSGSSLADLVPLQCAGYSAKNKFSLYVEPGVTYYFQLGSASIDNYGSMTITLDKSTLPQADFFYTPVDPSRFDTVNFCDQSMVEVDDSISNYKWDFGDGTLLETTEKCVGHDYRGDNNYTVRHEIQTALGLSAETVKTVPVSTHDVAITKLVAPEWVYVIVADNGTVTGETSQITVSVQANFNPEHVTVDLYKSTPFGYRLMETLVQDLDANTSTDFIFKYTFTTWDANQGQVTFKAVASLDAGRDIQPDDNTVTAAPTTVFGNVITMTFPMVQIRK